jgi:hypothetical protein
MHGAKHRTTTGTKDLTSKYLIGARLGEATRGSSRLDNWMSDPQSSDDNNATNYRRQCQCQWSDRAGVSLVGQEVSDRSRMTSIPGDRLGQSCMTEKQYHERVEDGEMGECAMSRAMWGQNRHEMHISLWIGQSSRRLNIAHPDRRSEAWVSRTRPSPYGGVAQWRPNTIQ